MRCTASVVALSVVPNLCIDKSTVTHVITKQSLLTEISAPMRPIYVEACSLKACRVLVLMNFVNVGISNSVHCDLSGSRYW